MKYILLALIKIYQIFLSFDHGIPHKLFPNVRVCIYHPSCSAYGYESIKRYGTFLGGWMTIKRVASCGPWSEGGDDPVPNRDLTGIKKFLTYI